jgi:Pectate lyase superfamily protein
MHRRNGWVALLVAVTACSEGPIGPHGPAGPPGPAGPNGALPSGYFDVLAYGAKADQPSLDSTASFQSALDAARSAGGGIVWVPQGRFWFSGNISIGANVVLAGAGVGPYDTGPDPATTTEAPKLLPTSTTGSAFISITGENSALQDLLIRYPNQVRPDAPGVADTGPTVYPPTVRVLSPAKIYRCSLTNSYIGIEVLVGRVYLENLHLSSFRNDIIIDHSEDFVHISHITVSIFGWDVGVAFPSPIDTWVMNNGVALAMYETAAISIDDFDVFMRNTGIVLGDSPDRGIPGHGTGGNIDLDTVRYGVVATSTDVVGYEFTNLAIGDALGGVNMIWLPAGGHQTPRVVVVGGSTWGPPWAEALKVEAGMLRVRDIVGLNPIGRLPALGIAAPALPPSGVAYVSTMPASAQVSISGGSVQDVRTGGQSTGLTSGMFEVAPGESIAVVYASAPAWSWFLE